MISSVNKVRNSHKHNKNHLLDRKFSAVVIFILMCGVFLPAGSVPAQYLTMLTGIEVNQALGLQKDNHKYFVAGKNTVVRVSFSPSAMIDRETTYVNVWRDGQPVFRIYPKNTGGYVMSSVDFLCKNIAACGNWAAGTYTFQPFVNGATAVSDPYVFSTGTKIRVLAVAVKANYGSGGIKSVSDTKWKTMGDFMQKVYPLAEDNLAWKIRETVLDASAAPYNLATVDANGETPGCKKLSDALDNLIPSRCKTSPRSEGCYDFVIGFINESLRQDNGNYLAGFAYPGGKSVVVVASDEDAAGTVAHEIAHQYGIGDTYDGEKTSSIRCSVNPAPNGFKGRDWDKGFPDGVVVSCTAGRLASTLTGTDGATTINGAQVSASDHPYDVYGRGILPEMADFMSAGGAWQRQMWITKDNYDWLFRRLVRQEAGLTKASRVVAASASAQRFVSFSGTLSNTDTVEINPWNSYTDTVTLSDSTGSLMVQAVNNTGTVLASTSFTVQFYMVHPPRTLTNAPFEGVINFPAGTVKFRIVKNGAVLAEVPVSDHAPTVAGVMPQTTTTLTGAYTINWTGNDTDGNNLTYTVEYNPDVTNASSGWMILADGLETSSFAQDFSQLPGGNHAKIRVSAYDGVLFGEAESTEFIVPLKNPEVTIDELPWGTTYNPGDDILLTVEAYDPQDGSLPDDKIRWTSDISGELGYGSELIVENLEEGRHTITVTATNSAGLSSRASITVQVGSSSGSGHCFVATAAFGSYLHPYVGMLRNFRDAYLLTNSAGQAFVRWYYRVSPPLAAFISQKVYARAAVRVVLLPVVGFSALALNIGLFWSVILLLAFMLFAGMGVRKLVRAGRCRA